ncbi:MAG: electron transfer flavoprotein subunit beta/FixA family protein [Thermoplasmata archaeon]|nr:electron transfer flavoprotein subunit beta/FixA family protein [Thermoplasmata archaeon]
MNIIVCAKQVVDVREIKIDKQTNKPILKGIGKTISDIDKNAVEEAIKLKEENKDTKVTVLSVAPFDAREQVKELLAMGADEAVLVSPPEEFDYNTVSTLLAKAIEKIGDYDLILCGEASVDLFSGQMGPRIAGLLDIPQITYARAMSIEGDKVRAERDLTDKAVKMESTFPVLITVTKEINKPRLPSLMGILGAASKPIIEWDGSDLLEERMEPGIKSVDLRGVSMERKNVVYGEDPEEGVRKLVISLGKEGLLG